MDKTKIPFSFENNIIFIENKRIVYHLYKKECQFVICFLILTEVQLNHDMIRLYKPLSYKYTI